MYFKQLVDIKQVTYFIVSGISCKYVFHAGKDQGNDTKQQKASTCSRKRQKNLACDILERKKKNLFIII